MCEGAQRPATKVFGTRTFLFLREITAMNLLVGLKATKAVGVEIKRLEKGLDRVDLALSLVGDQCKLGCQGEVCSDEPRTFHEPGSCRCKAMTLELKFWDQQATPDGCARNTATFTNSTGYNSSESEPFYSMALSSKVTFSSMGCYVGTNDDADEWGNSCPEAYASQVFDGT